MIVRHTVHAAELFQIILVRYVVSLPCHDVERGEILFRDKDLTAEFVYLYSRELFENLVIQE